MEPMTKWHPCWQHYEGHCECFAPDDMEDGLPIFWSRPYCRLREIDPDTPSSVEEVGKWSGSE